MDDLTPSSQPESSPPVSPPPKPEALEESVKKAFVGRNGIRAAWRLLIFLVILGALIAGVGAVSTLFANGKPYVPPFTAAGVCVSEGVIFFLVLMASWIMSKIEGRTIADYGLPARQAFRGNFWLGIVIGFLSITALLATMRLRGVFYFGTIALHGAEIAKYAALWGLAFLFTGLLEEFMFRGYALFTLTTGITFWPAAILLSTAFGFVHRSNPGENSLGAFTAGAAGFLFCLILRRTGDLWMAIGFHAAWDWGETYFYGVADSGLIAPGHLFNSKLAPQPVWLTGGSVGPEGSWLCLALLVLLWIVFAVWLRDVKYPDPAAISNQRRKSEPLSIFAPDQQV